MGDVMPSAARRLARFVIGLRLDDVPSPVVTKAALLVLDTLGCALASTRYDFGRAAVQTAERLGGPQESTLVGSKVRVAAANAVLANATLAHGLDFDDTREDAIVHTGSVAVTTSLAVGEARGASGRAALEAMVAGVETMCRVGLAGPGKFHARRYHPTALAGAFGAAAVAGGFDARRLEELLASLGREWELERLTFKPYPCGSIAHPYMDCALRLRELHRLRPDQITDVRCRTAAGPVDRLWEPLAAKQA